jgi:hypothetical protein
VLHGQACARLERALAHPADARLELPGDRWRLLRVGEQVATAHVQVVLELHGDGHRRDGRLQRAVGGLDRRDPRAAPGRQHHDLVAGAPNAACHLPCVAAVVVVLVGHRPDHPLDREAPVVEIPIALEVDRLEVLEQGRSHVPRHRVGAVHDVVAAQCRDRDRAQIGHAELLGELLQLGDDLREALLREAGEIHLVDGHHHVRDAEDGRDVRVAARLLDDAATGVEQDHGQVRSGGTRDHVARVLDMPGSVGELEAAARGDEGAVGDVDGDALLALGAQAVREQREVDVAVASALARRLDVLELVGEDLLRVVEQPADQRRLAVVDRAARHEPQQLGLHECLRSSQGACGPPWPLR